MIRFLHTADWQLGLTRHFLTLEDQSRFTGARIDAISKMGNIAVDEGCDFIVVCGDVFESSQVQRPVVTRALDAMAATPSVTFYLLPGNHDPLDASSVYRSRTFVERCPANVVVLTDSEPLEVAPNVDLVAAPWFSKRPLTDLVAAAIADLPSAPERVRVVVAHGAFDIMSPSTSDPALIQLASVEAAIADGRIAYVALGDRHSTTSIGTTNRVWYSGSPEPTDYVETDPGNALIVTVEGTEVRTDTVSIGTWRFVRHEADLADVDDCRLLSRWLDALPSKDRTIVKLGLTGQLSLSANAELDEILALHSDLFGGLEHWDLRSDLVVLPDELDLDRLGVSGFAKDAVTDLRQAAEASGPDAQIARDALTLLYRLGQVVQ